MISIARLIEEQRTGGVPHMEVGEIFHIRGGYTPARSTESLWVNGTVPWVRMDDIRTNGRLLDHALISVTPAAVKGKAPFEANSLIISTSATIGEHALVTVPFICNQRFTCLSIRPEHKHRFDAKFLFYCFFSLSAWCKENTTTSSFATVDMAKFRRFRLPVPPLTAQKAIANALDCFEQLDVELEKESTLRRSQISFYSRAIFKHVATEVERPLAEVSKFEWGSSLAANERVPGDFAVVTAGRAATDTHNETNFPADSITISTHGAYAGHVGWWSSPIWLSNNVFRVTPLAGEVHPKFLYFALKYVQVAIRRKVKHGGVPYLNANDLRMIRIPVPSLTTQQRVAHALDQMEALALGIATEAALRRKQYEYYRERLLTFEELPS